MSKNMPIVVPLLIGVALVACLVFLNMPLGPLATVSVEPGNVEVASEGQQVVLTLHIANVQDLYAWQVDLRWDGSATFIEATLPSSHVFSGQEMFGPVIAEETDGVQVGCTLLGTESSFSGAGVLVEAKFRMTGVGNSVDFWLSSDRSILVDSEGNEIPLGVG